MSPGEVGLPEALERAAGALPNDAQAIRPANGDPSQLRRRLDDAAAVRVLSWLLHHELDAGAALAGAWADDSGGGAELLQQLDVAGLPKPARKVLRRALHQLRSRGVPLHQAAPPQRVATLPPVDDSIDAALLTPLDARGARGAYLAVSHPSGGVRLFELVIDDERGVLEFEVYSSGRSMVRRFLRDFQRRERFAAVPAPADAVRALIARAIARQPPERPLPRGLAEWRSQVSEPPEGASTPGELARDGLVAPEADATELLAAAAALVSSGQLGPWPPPAEATREVAEKIADSGSGVIIVSGVQRREQVYRIIDEAADALYAGSFATQTAQRWEESAYLFWKGGREDDARACLAAARAFRAGEASGNPVARAALEVILAPALEAVQDDEKGEGGTPLLVGAS